MTMTMIDGREYSEEEIRILIDHYKLSEHQMSSIVGVANKRKAHRHPVFYPALSLIEERPELLDDSQAFTHWLECVGEVYCK